MTEIGVGLVGYKFMGRAHSNAYRQVARFFDADPIPRMRVLCGRNEGAVREAANALGWEDYETDYVRMLQRDDVGLVDISSSGDTHHEFALAALRPESTSSARSRWPIRSRRPGTWSRPPKSLAR